MHWKEREESCSCFGSEPYWMPQAPSVHMGERRLSWWTRVTLSPEEISTLNNRRESAFVCLVPFLIQGARSQDLVDQKHLAPSSPQQKGEFLDGPWCWLKLWELVRQILHALSHQLLLLTDVMVIYKTAQNKTLPPKMLFAVQPLQKTVLAVKKVKNYISIWNLQSCNVSWSWIHTEYAKVVFPCAPHKMLKQQEGLDLMCLYHRAECAGIQKANGTD